MKAADIKNVRCRANIFKGISQRYSLGGVGELANRRGVSLKLVFGKQPQPIHPLSRGKALTTAPPREQRCLIPNSGTKKLAPISEVSK